MISLIFILALVVSPGKDRWEVKIMPPDPSNIELAFTAGEMLALRDVSSVTKSDARYKDKRIPNTMEGRLASVTGYLRLVGMEPDGDYHIQLSETPISSQVVIIEVPSPKFVHNKILSIQAKRIRETIDRILGKMPSFDGVVLSKPIKITFTGALFYDDAHVGTPSRGKKGMKAPSLWELHPATKIFIHE